MSRKYTRRNPGDLVNGAELVSRVNSRLWNIKCKRCGKIFVSQPSETSGFCRDCAYKNASVKMKKHGESPGKGKNATRLYGIWLGMKNRCYNPKSKEYNYYGGKGIKVCEEWQEYYNFKKWSIDNGYSDELSIDRIDGC